MLFQINYKNNTYYSLRIIGDIVGCAHLSEDKKMWKYSVKLNDGIYRYKFLINDIIRLNNPSANEYIKDENGEVWSLLIIHNGDVATNYNSIQLHSYIISDKIEKIIDPRFMKTNFNTNIDNQIYLGMQVDNIMGAHSVTVMWQCPDLSISHIEEHCLFFNNEYYVNAQIWFWINVSKNKQYFPKGIWSVNIFVDGKFIIKRAFSLNTAYSRELNLFSARV